MPGGDEGEGAGLLVVDVGDELVALDGGGRVHVGALDGGGHGGDGGAVGVQLVVVDRVQGSLYRNAKASILKMPCLDAPKLL